MWTQHPDTLQRLEATSSTQSIDTRVRMNMDDNETLLTIGNEAAIFGDFTTLIEGCLIPFISVLGLIGNSLSIMVLQSSVLDMKVRNTHTDFTYFMCVF